MRPLSRLRRARAASLPSLLVPLASRAARFRPSRRERTFGARPCAYFHPVCRPHPPTPSRTARPRTRRGVKWRRTTSSASPDSSRRRVSGRRMWTTPPRSNIRRTMCRAILSRAASPSVKRFGRYSHATTGGCATKSENPSRGKTDFFFLPRRAALPIRWTSHTFRRSGRPTGPGLKAKSRNRRLLHSTHHHMLMLRHANQFLAHWLDTGGRRYGSEREPGAKPPRRGAEHPGTARSAVPGGGAERRFRCGPLGHRMVGGFRA